MSTVWQTRHRLLLEHCDALAARLGSDEPPDQADLRDHAARLLAAVVRLLRQHQVNRSGRCVFCGWSRRARRLWRRRPRCTVVRAVDHALRQDSEVMWHHLITDTDRRRARTTRAPGSV